MTMKQSIPNKRLIPDAKAFLSSWILNLSFLKGFSRGVVLPHGDDRVFRWKFVFLNTNGVCFLYMRASQFSITLVPTESRCKGWIVVRNRTFCVRLHGVHHAPQIGAESFVAVGQQVSVCLTRIGKFYIHCCVVYGQTKFVTENKCGACFADVVHGQCANIELLHNVS